MASIPKWTEWVLVRCSPNPSRGDIRLDQWWFVGETMWNLPILLIPGANMHQPTLLLVGQMVTASWNNLEISDESGNMYQISWCFLLNFRAWQGLHPSDWWEVSAPCHGVVPAAKHLETWLLDQLNQPNQARPEHSYMFPFGKYKTNREHQSISELYNQFCRWYQIYPKFELDSFFAQWAYKPSSTAISKWFRKPMLRYWTKHW